MKQFLEALTFYTAISTMALTGIASAQPNDTNRIVSAGNGVTEIIYALGAGDQVVAVDSTSSYPESVNALPKLGYHKQLSAEGILALKPSMLIGTEDMGPPSSLSQLNSAGVSIKSLPLNHSVKNIEVRITELAKILGKEQQGEALLQELRHSLNQARKLFENRELSENRKKPKVLFLLAMGGRTPSVSGRNTAANTLIELAGGNNAAAEQFTGYKPLANEALLQMSPDFILYADSGSGMSPEQLLAMQPIISQTPAGRSGRILPLDGRILLGGLGPRTGKESPQAGTYFLPELSTSFIYFN